MSKTPVEATQTQSLPTAAEIAAARQFLHDKAIALHAEGVQPKDIDALDAANAVPALVAIIAAHATDFAQYDVTAALAAAATQVAGELTVKVQGLPADLRKLRRLGQEEVTLIHDASALLGKYFAFINLKVRGDAQRKAAQHLGVGSTKGQSVEALELNYRDVLTAAKDQAAVALFGIKSHQLNDLQTMHGKLSTQHAARPQEHATTAALVRATDLQQMELELFFGEASAAAEWALPDHEVAQFHALVPRSDPGRGKAKAPAATGEAPPPPAAEEEEQA